MSIETVNGQEVVGTVAVDAGCIWIGDPCYTLTTDGTYCQDSKGNQLDWDKFCNLLGDKKNEVADHVQQPLGDTIGLVVGSGYGDGCYPVTVTRDGNNRIASVTVHFIEDDNCDGWE